jgi:hypothetical protein
MAGGGKKRRSEEKIGQDRARLIRSGDDSALRYIQYAIQYRFWLELYHTFNSFSSPTGARCPVLARFSAPTPDR